MESINGNHWTRTGSAGVIDDMVTTLIRTVGIVVLAAVTGAACVLEAVAAWPLR
jgi:hydroxyethylthiazole kinase-like sugar kinase family protein